MPRSHTALTAPLIGLAATLSSSCEESLAPPDAMTGAFQVSVATTGPEFAPEAYRISVDDKSHRPVAINGATLFSGLAPGAYRLQLEDVPTSCAVLGTNPRTVTIGAGTTRTVEFNVNCRAMGSVQVAVVTTGVDPDPDGYTVTVDPSTGGRWVARISSSTPVWIQWVDAGDHIVTLHGLALNCEVRDSVSQPVIVAVRGTTLVTFTVECSPVTQLAFVAYDHSDFADIYIAKSNGTGAINLTKHPTSDLDPAWSPDGRTIAFTSDRDGTDQIYLMNADGSGVTRLTTRGAAQATWSPDGQKIAFTRGFNWSRDIYVMNADGSGQVQITTDAAADFQPAWSPDGRTIAFVSDRDGNAELYTMNSDGTRPVRLTNTQLYEAEPAWSPDGRRLAFSRQQCYAPLPKDCESTVLVWNVGSLEEPRTLTAGYQPAWSPNGRILAYTSRICVGHYDYYDTCDPFSIDFVREDGTNNTHLIHSAMQAAWRP